MSKLAPTVEGALLDGAAVLGAVLVALLVHALLVRLLGRLVRHTSWGADDLLLKHLSRPLRPLLVVLALQLVRPLLELGPTALEFVEHLLSLSAVACFTWLVLGALHGVAAALLAREEPAKPGDFEARRLQTQVKVLVRVLQVIIVVIGVSAALMTFPQIRQLGTSLLASAGIAGLVLGMAAQSTLANLIAGVQIALTQPIRLDDLVTVAGETGRVEEIGTSYVVVRVWDERRLIVPFAKFISEPFQNWTRSSRELLGTVFVYADYKLPVEELRAETERLVRGSELWDGRAVGLVATNASEQTLELRALVSAGDSGKLWELRCWLREQLVGWLQREHPECLPRTRLELPERPVTK